MIKEIKAFVAPSQYELAEYINHWIEDNDNKKIQDIKFAISGEEEKSFIAYIILVE